MKIRLRGDKIIFYLIRYHYRTSLLVYKGLRLETISMAEETKVQLLNYVKNERPFMDAKLLVPTLIISVLICGTLTFWLVSVGAVYAFYSNF